MLRRVIAAILLAAIGCGFYFWSHIKTDTVNSLLTLVDKTSSQIHAGDTSAAFATIEEIKKVYQEKQELFNMVADHEFVNTLSDYISEIEVGLNNNDKSRTDTAIAYLRNHITDFYNDSKLKLSNVI